MMTARWFVRPLAAVALVGGVITAAPVGAQVDVGAATRPAIVKITYTSVVKDRAGRSIEVQSLGSGVLFDGRGYIATNAHVIAEATGPVKVDLNDGRSFQGMVVGKDRMTDVAVVKVTGENLPTAPVGDSSLLTAGQAVAVIGHSPLRRNPTAGAPGRVAGTDAFWLSEIGAWHEGLIRTTVVAAPGDSGGALIDANGRVVGMTVLRRDDIAADRWVEGLHIPINQVMKVAQEIVAEGRVDRGYVGVWVMTMTPEIARVYGFPRERGVLIQMVDDEGPAWTAGLRRGDTILAVDGQEVWTREQLRAAVTGHHTGETIVMSGMRRAGAPFTMRFSVVQRPDDDDAFDRLSFE